MTMTIRHGPETNSLHPATTAESTLPIAMPPRPAIGRILIQRAQTADPLPHARHVPAAALADRSPHIGIPLHDIAHARPHALAAGIAEHVSQDVVAQLADADPALGRVASAMQGRLGGEPVEGGGDEGRDAGGVGAAGANAVADVGEEEKSGGQDGKRLSMSRQRKACGSSDGAAEGESGEGGAAEETSWDLVSFVGGELEMGLFLFQAGDSGMLK